MPLVTFRDAFAGQLIDTYPAAALVNGAITNWAGLKTRMTEASGVWTATLPPGEHYVFIGGTEPTSISQATHKWSVPATSAGGAVAPTTSSSAAIPERKDLLSFTQAQTLTSDQQAFVRSKIGAGAGSSGSISLARVSDTEIVVSMVGNDSITRYLYLTLSI